MAAEAHYLMIEPLDLDAIEARWNAVVLDGDADAVGRAGRVVEPLIAEVRRLRLMLYVAHKDDYIFVERSPKTPLYALLSDAPGSAYSHTTAPGPHPPEDHGAASIPSDVPLAGTGS